MGKVDDLRALREAKYGKPRERRPIGLASHEPVRAEDQQPSPPAAVPDPVAPVPSLAPLAAVTLVENSEDARPARPIQAYKQAELEEIVAGLYAPGMSPEQMIDAVCAHLGFLRRGKVIKVRVREAFEARCA